MAEHLLEGGERTTRFKPTTREGVSKLMRVEAPKPAASSNLPGEAIGVSKRQQPPDAATQLTQQVIR
jgi:hypothetical protein